MNGDSDRAAQALQLIVDREKRYRFFSSSLFDEYAWEMLLHLFVALSKNETMSETKLLGLVHATPEIGRRWLHILVKAGQVESRNDGDDVVLIDGAVDQLRAYLSSLPHEPGADQS